jgi:hypothetical protein
MTEIIQASNLELYEVEEKFHLQEVSDPLFFTEWQNVPTVMTSYEQHWLDQAKEDFLSLKRHPLHEEIVKMVVLAPLFSMAGLCRDPFMPAAEKRIEIRREEDEEMIRGRIDLLVLHQRLWVSTVETKPKRSDVIEALPQALLYMMSSPSTQNSLFGLLTNGNHFLFLKLVKQPTPQYALSDLFTLFKHDNDLYRVLAVLRHLKELVVSEEWQTQHVG